ncbi:MAG: DEAD/DEAH box helicase [Candidatus Micrarchaeia archaeon]
MENKIYALFLGKYGGFTDIQREAIPAVAEGGNCLIIAPTGSGKTEAAVLPVIQKLYDEKEKQGKLEGIKAIYITPLRALNRDLLKRLKWLSEETGIEIAVRHGDTPQSERQMQAAHPPAVLITTPESVQNLFLSQRLRHSLSNVEAVIVDEVHELFMNKRGAQLAIALERLAELSRNFQRIGISATVGNIDEVKGWLSAGAACKVVESTRAKALDITIEMPLKPKREMNRFREKLGINETALARIERIAEIVRSSKSVLVFANTRQIVESLGNKLIYFDKQEPFGGIGVHHSSLDKNERISVENAFKEGALKSIIATSSLELGIDIGSVDYVIQYGSPKQATRLVQRVGRGGHRERAVARGSIIVANAVDALESVAILQQAKSGALEKQHMQRYAKDVLINQLCAMSLEYSRIRLEKAYAIVARAAPYASMSIDEFKKIAAFAAEQRLIRLANGDISQSARTRAYFYANISVIPEIAKYMVKDVVTNKTIGSLDESFVSNYLDEGTTFITKGMPWKVVSIENNTVQAEQSADVEAAIPDWEGEDIPVTKATAEKVFELMQHGVAEQKNLMDSSAYATIEAFVKKQAKFFAPSQKKLVIENGDNFSIIYMPLGKLANELIARLLSRAVSLSYSRQASVSATPYAVFVKYQNFAALPDIARFFKLGGLLQLMNSDAYITDSDIFRYRLVQAAKLSGVVDKKATITRSGAQKLANFYADTPVFEEAKRDLLQNYFDTETAVAFLNDVKNGKVKVEVENGISPFGEELLKANYAYGELLVETRSEDEINAFEKEIVGKKAELFCTYCGFVFEQEIKGSDYRILCSRCKSPMVCIYSDSRLAAWQSKKKGKELNEKQQHEYDSMMREASLVEAYGNRALVALTTYGVGIETAARVLRMLRKSYRQLYVDLLNAQRNFVRTKKYWKQR